MFFLWKDKKKLNITLKEFLDILPIKYLQAGKEASYTAEYIKRVDNEFVMGCFGQNKAGIESFLPDLNSPGSLIVSFECEKDDRASLTNTGIFEIGGSPCALIGTTMSTTRTMLSKLPSLWANSVGILRLLHAKLYAAENIVVITDTDKVHVLGTSAVVRESCGLTTKEISPWVANTYNGNSNPWCSMHRKAIEKGVKYYRLYPKDFGCENSLYTTSVEICDPCMQKLKSMKLKKMEACTA